MSPTMTPLALTRVCLIFSLLCASLLAPFALSQTADSVTDDQAGFDRLGLTEALIVQAEASPHLIALQQDNPDQDSEGPDVDGEADAVSESPDGWVEGGHRYAARKADEMTQWVNSINAVADPGSGSGAGRAQTLPAGERRPGDEPKKRSFFTLKKK